MKNIFITDATIHSPRWLEAFPHARLVQGQSNLDSLTSDSRCWVVASPDQDWTKVVAQLTAQGAQVVVLSLQPDRLELTAALANGAKGYLEAFANKEILKQVAVSLSQGALWLPADAVAQLAGTLQLRQAKPGADDTKRRLSGLTVRELEVVETLSQGKTNKEIALQLAISERTVKEHLGAVFQKLQVKDRLQLALLFNQHSAE